METENDALLQVLYHFCRDKEFLMLGDFNIPSVQWVLNYVLCASYALGNRVVDVFTELGLIQMVQ